MRLNPDQYEAVTSTALDLCIVAGPGSGKTRVLIERIRHLVALGIDPKGIVVMTFTNAGAHELKTRLASYEIHVRYVGTLHGFCFRLIQRHGRAVGYRAGAVTLLDEKAAKALMEECRVAMRRMITDKDLAAGASEDAQLIHREYRHRLKRNNLVDYNRVLEVGLSLVHLVEPISDLLLDEWQDSGEIDWQIADALPYERRAIVADPDQSIYAFRGARPDLVTHHAKSDGVATLLLERNYRSAPVICDKASRLIAHNRNRVEKVVTPNGASEGVVRLMSFQDCRHEATRLSGIVTDLHDTESVPWPEIAVLTRRNSDRAAILDALAGRGIPVKSKSTRMPSDWKKALLLLGLLIDPRSEVHTRAWLEETVGAVEANRRALRATAAGTTLHELSPVVPLCFKLEYGKTREALARFGISDPSLDMISARMEVLPHDDPTPEDLLHDLWNHDRWSGDQKGDGVEVLTIHASKGREFDAVIVACCEEGLLPNAKADLEEERRLMFVAVTRARKFLTITHAFQRANAWGGPPQPTQPSRFIKEMSL